MFRTSIAAVSIAGSAALAVAALAGTPASAAPGVGAPEPAPAQVSVAKKAVDSTSFRMVRSAGAVAANCLPNAKANVTIKSKGDVEVMRVYASGLPKKTDFDLFVLQVPDAKFGMAWYQGDLETDKHGNAYGKFIGRFSIETF